MDEKNKIRKLWFGVDKIELPLLVTPLPGIKQELLRSYELQQELGGWYNPSVISLNNNSYLLMEVPRGRASEDIAKAIESSKPVYMLGYGGGLSPDLQIGDIVQDSDNSVFILEFRRVRIQTVDGLLDKKYSEDSEVVDMENDFYKKHLDNYSGYFVVSDLPHSRPFFNITQLDKRKIRQSQTKLIKLLGETI